MNTKYKIIIPVLTIILLAIIVGGYLMHQKNKEQEAFITKQKPYIELFYTYNYQSIKNFTYTDTKKLPTGTTVISGYVNDNPSLSFEADVPSGMFFESQGTVSKDLRALVKPEYRYQSKKVSTILKEQGKSIP